MRDQIRRTLLVTAALLLCASLLTACTLSVAGGVAGGVLALLMGAGLLLTAAGTTGCDERVTGCLSIAVEAGPDGSGKDAGPDSLGGCLSPPIDFGPDGKVNPCLSVDAKVPDMHVGPCLQPPMPDQGKPDMHVGPCLSPPAPDMSQPDVKVGPCLKPPKPDMGKPDAKVGPCLSPPPKASPGHGPFAAAGASADPRPVAAQRAEVIAKISQRLPAELAARLEGEDHPEG